MKETCALFIAGAAMTLFSALGACAEPAPGASEQTYAEKLGWPAGSRVVIFHIDDAGMSHDSNEGVIEAMEKGVATSTSIMFPCPWVSEYAQYWKEHPGLDVGVHVTLTSEWKKYRWAPVAGKKAVPGLVDEEGCMWADVPQTMFKASPDEVETEIRAQLDRCLTMGLKPTHLDSHMGTVFANINFFERYLKVGIENGIPVMLPAGHMEYVSKEVPLMVDVAKQMGKKAWDAGLPVLDDVNTGGGAKSPADKKEQIIQFLRTFKPGVTQFIVHCTRPSEIFKEISGSGEMRLAELNAMCDPDIRKVIDEEKIIVTTWKELKERRDKVGAAQPQQPAAK
jgi:predicted glycoside hydrolase/deacetylase ChbG (UPF0249 family)